MKREPGPKRRSRGIGLHWLEGTVIRRAGLVAILL